MLLFFRHYGTPKAKVVKWRIDVVFLLLMKYSLVYFLFPFGAQGMIRGSL